MNKIKGLSSAMIPSRWGEYEMKLFGYSDKEEFPHFALVHPEVDLSKPVTIRIHSECLTGDLLGSKRCDCGEQLDAAMQVITRDKGILLYLRQEGRGIGIVNKLKAYQLQDKGRNTIQANVELGFGADEREYGEALAMLNLLGVRSVNLISNNPKKIEAIEQSKIELVRRVPIVIKAQKENESYLEVKKTQMGHLLDDF